MSITQKDAFMQGEGDAYHARNREQAHATDPVLTALAALVPTPRVVLEIGCGDGWRLAQLRRRWQAECHGIDPSAEAVREGSAQHAGLALRQGTADALPYEAGRFDLVVFGFCLYLCDRQDLFRIAAEADRVLREGGVLAIFDFHPPAAYRNRYAHRPGLYSYKMQYDRAFTWNPAYTMLAQQLTTHAGPDPQAEPDDRLAVTLLRKDSRGAYPDNPYRRQG